MSLDQSSLDRILSAQYCPGLDKLISKICEGCPFVEACRLDKIRCRYVNVILGMTAKISVKSEGERGNIHSYLENLKETISDCN